MSRLDQQFPKEFLFPNYGDLHTPGTTLANVPAAAARLLGASLDGLPPLPDEYWQPLLADGPVERVVLLVIDAMGRSLFPAEATPISRWEADRPQVNRTITSVAPSTTVNALSSLWTASAPAQHGLIGIRLHFPEYGVVANMLKNSPNISSRPDDLLKVGLNTKNFLARPSLAAQLLEHGIDTHSFKPREIIRSALSQMHDRDCRSVSGALSFADMLWQIGDLLEKKRSQPLLAVGYWPTVDSLSHRYGPDHPAVLMEASVLLAQINELLVQTLSPAARQKTAVLITADHGQVNIDPNRVVYLEDHPILRQSIILDGPGEPRKPYLYVRHGTLEQTIAYSASALSDRMMLQPAQEALAEGWFGPPPYAPQTVGRLGDLVGFMRPQATFIPAVDRHLLEERKMVAMHGGLSPDEMRAPFWGMTL